MTRQGSQEAKMADPMSTERGGEPSIFRALRGYPWLPCPICGGTESCDDTVLERARRAHPGLHLPSPPPSGKE